MFSPKTRRRKSFVPRKFRPQSITTLPVQLSKNQTTPTNAFVEKVSNSGNAVGNGECQTYFEKIQKISAFLTKTGREKI